MWVCPECSIKNIETAEYCSVCGTSPDGTKKVKPSQFAEQVGVTRRFSVGTFMIMSTLFGVLFAVLTLLNVKTIVFGCIVVFFTGIGLAQMFMFAGQDPRRASWVAGFPMGFVCALIGCIVDSWTGVNIWFGEYLGITVLCTVFGGPCGYLAGCLIAGIFLVRERESDEEDDAQSTFDEDEET